MRWDGDEHQYLFTGYQGEIIAGSKDGQWLYLNNSRQDLTQIKRIRTDGSQVEYLVNTITPPHTSDIRPLSYHGFIFYHQGKSYYFDMETHQVIYLTQTSNTIRFVPAPDETGLYVFEQSQGVYKLPLEDNPAREQIIDEGFIEFKQWSADNTGFYYYLKGDYRTLHYFDLRTGQSKQLAHWDLIEHRSLTYIAPTEDYLLVSRDDNLCKFHFVSQDKKCLIKLSGRIFLRSWSPSVHEKIWHPNHLLLSSVLLIGCSGAVVYFAKDSL